ncbi:hypothetical protein ACIMS1_005367 [Vibrio harveyi]
MTEHKTIPRELKKHMLSFDWNEQIVWEEKAEIEQIPISKIDYLLVLPFWEKPGYKSESFNLSPMDVLRNPDLYQNHFARIIDSNCEYPLDFLLYEDKIWILDGLHRLCKLYLEGSEYVSVRIHTDEVINKIKI